MGFKDLFFVNDKVEEQSKKIEPNKSTSTFPNTANTQQKTTFPNTVNIEKIVINTNLTEVNPVCQPHIDSVMKMYEQGFEGLNMTGYDFFEYYQSIISAGIDNPQIYNMALMMAKGIDKTVSKESLLSQSDFYITEINKVYKTYVDKGQTKRNEVTNQKENENKNLVAELDNLKMQLESIKNQIQSKESLLSQIDSKYSTQLTEIDCKLMANDHAKDVILGSITKVKNGIINNLK